ncbi:hypothetical protein [Providencia phage Kokobel2]|nr:hypothetical protein [Providencia phage Kokobel2]
MNIRISNGKPRDNATVYNVSRPVYGSLTTLESVGRIQQFDDVDVVTFIATAGGQKSLASRDIAGWKYEISQYLNLIGA